MSEVKIAHVPVFERFCNRFHNAMCLEFRCKGSNYFELSTGWVVKSNERALFIGRFVTKRYLLANLAQIDGGYVEE